MEPRTAPAGELVDRDAELSTVDDVLATGRTGPVALTVTGEAGVGKTTVWLDCLARARARGHRVLSCRAAESEVRLSFGGLVDLMQAVTADTLIRLPEPQRDALECALLRRSAGPAVIDRRAVYLGVLGAIRVLASESPVVIAVDDAQWLDDASAGVLDYVIRRLSGEAIAVVTSMRSPGEDAVPFALFDGERTHRLHLRGLSLDGLHRLLRARTGRPWPRPALIRLHETSGGNPFYALEIARAMDRAGTGRTAAALPLPRTLAEVVGERITALAEPTREALLYVAAMPRPQVTELAAALGEHDDPADALQDAEDAGVIEIHGGTVRFTHPLLASTVYADAAPGRRRQVHARLAQAAFDTEAGAWHLALASTRPEQHIATALEAAARRALARGAPSSAADLLELAARHASVAERPRLLAAAAERLFFAGDAEGARRRYEDALAETPPGEARVRILLDLALAVFYEEGPTQAVPLCDQALAEAGGDVTLAAVAHLRKAWYSLNDHVGRARSARSAVDLLEGGDAPPDLHALALLSAAWFAFHAGHGFVPAEVERARALLPADGPTREASMARNALRVFPRYLDPLRARADIEAVRAAAADTGDESSAMQSLVHLSEMDCWTGDWHRARREAARAVEAAEQIGQKPWRPYARYVLAQAAACLGDLDTARTLAREGLRTATEADDSWVSLHHLAVLGFIALSEGDAAGADRRLTAAEELCAEIGLGDLGICDHYGDHVEAVTVLGDLPRARLLLDRLGERARRAPRPWIEAVWQRSRAVVLTAAGELDEAETAARAALDAHPALPMPFLRARTMLVLGRLRRRGKRKLVAREALLAAREGFAELGAVAWIAMADDELDRLGLRRGTEHDLTPTEERIARLVNDGMSNREVAAALYVTPKTVEAHLSRIYRKLGVGTRKEMAEAMRREEAE
ncbi:helix-turn-helix transcriptional regulator [Phytomonospora endophytica]|uniref:DNA-binding CsgD family transcriptional regulator n=1 Tax=Phytomonospora endophytica TaxID=714109 RepID=A0A841FPX9_9ACTN|nr:LuxR family transcriptional regulator [Phytomonospora endophytica]MBB6036893.1 DNA-binding CsgD family transcriptional regulator [Phytomonospora endophytica]